MDTVIDHEKAEQLQELVKTNPRVPVYHFICPQGINGPFDPNGAIFWQGRYHLFYIFPRPRSTDGNVFCWGHASSIDLLHWDYHPTALDCPEEPDPQDHIFSGGAFLDKSGKPTIIYHGVRQGTCIAVPEDDDLIRWRKFPENPVIPNPQKEGDPGWGVYNVFDPHAWIYDDDYYAILGGKVKPDDRYDTAYLFKSPDLINWEYQSPFYQPNPAWTGGEEDCACPDFFQLGDRWMLSCISHPCGARYYLGRYENGLFIPEEHHRMNWPGGPCFAPESLKDDQDRRIFWAWVLEQRQGEDLTWDEYGVMTMPRVLSLNDRGQLQIDPPEELKQIRDKEFQVDRFTLAIGEETVLEEIFGDVMEVELEVSVPTSGIFGLKVRMSPDREEETIIRVDSEKSILAIDTTKGSLDPYVIQRYPISYGDTESRDIRIQEAPFKLEPGELLRLRVFLDKSIMEVYANSRQCITQRIYPTRPDSLGMAVFCDGRSATVNSVSCWNITPTNG